MESEMDFERREEKPTGIVVFALALCLAIPHIRLSERFSAILSRLDMRWFTPLE